MADVIPDMGARPALSPADSYRFCMKFARDHYENFPVASLLVPADVRRHIAAVYTFARIADDIADEGTDDAATRLRALADWRRQLERATDARGEVNHPVFVALRDTLALHDIDPSLLHDLLDAFEQDARSTTYPTFDALLGYCRLSANPVGRIVLGLSGLLDDARAAWSDALCTGLQLANFLQDLSIDLARNRLFLPLEDLARFGVDRTALGTMPATRELRALMRFEVGRTREFFHRATPLFNGLPPRLGFELRATWYGGMRILDRIEALDFDTMSARPVLRRSDVALLAMRALFARPPAGVARDE